MPTPLALLAIFAHPDDESFGTGGALAHYAAQGTVVSLVCATRGEVGEIADSSLATPETLPQVREQELRCACQKMGINPPIFLGYRDSGMEGTPENEDPAAFVNTPAEVVVPRLVGLIRQLRPQVVITFDPDGGYGHPDHIAIHRHTVAAFHAAADPAQYPEQGPAWRSRRLFYGVLPISLFKKMHRRLKELDLDTGPFERFEAEDIGWPDEAIDLTLDVSETVETKWAALECHRTQFGPENPFRQLPRAEVHQMMSQEHFVLAWPETKPDWPAADLFAGL